MYENTRDDIVAIGSMAECSQQLHMTGVWAFYDLLSQVKTGKRKKYCILEWRGESDDAVMYGSGQPYCGHWTGRREKRK